MVVLAILLGLAVPAFNQFIQNNRLASQANEMVGALQFARTEALKRGVWTEVCASDDGENCSGDFADGWIAFCDPSDDLCDEENEAPLRVWSAPDKKLDFDTQQSFARFLPSGCFDHDRNGRCSAPQADPDDEQPLVKIEDSSDNENIIPRLVWISATGRVSACREDKNEPDSCES